MGKNAKKNLKHQFTKFIERLKEENGMFISIKIEKLLVHV